MEEQWLHYIQFPIQLPEKHQHNLLLFQTSTAATLEKKAVLLERIFKATYRVEMHPCICLNVVI